MKLTPAMKIILAVAAICLAITLITTNNIATVMVLYGLGSTPTVATPSTGNNSQNVDNSNQGGYDDNSSQQQTVVPDTTQSAATQQPSGNNANTNNSNANNGNANTGNSGATENKGDTAAIVEEFNKAVNSVKTGAKTVQQKSVTNYLAGKTETGGLSSIYKMLGGDDWLDGMLRDNSQGEATYQGADIIAKFPVEGQNWSSKLTAADVKEANRSEKNGVITITITTIADEKSDSVKVGEGHAPKAFNVILPSVVNDNIPGAAKSLSGTASMAYPESTVTVTIDAKTGNVITADYDLKWTINFDKMSVVLPFGTKASYTVSYK